MATKRKRKDGKLVVQSPHALRELWSSSIANHVSAEIALLRIMEEHDFDLSTLQQILSEDRIDISFSNVRYESIASFVGLDAGLKMRDIDSATFELHRSRIPTTLFKSIVRDMDIMLVQYGPPIEHETEEARSQFLSPIFNRLVAVFDFAFRNQSESVLEGRITTKGRMEYHFKAFGCVAVLFIKFKLKTGSAKERLDAIAQVLAECDAGDWNNARQGFRVAMYGILCDGDVFEFFCFDGSTKPPSFYHGCDPTTPRSRLQLPDFTQTANPRLFINALRPICEIIFDLMLNGYISCLKAYHKRSAENSAAAKEATPGKSLDKWEQAISSAQQALGMFRDAETKRGIQLIDEANAIVQEAMKSLKCSINEVPIIHKSVLVMCGWDDKEVEKV